MKTTLAVIGGAGFLGRALIDRLGDAAAIRCLDRVPFPEGQPRPAAFVEWVGHAQDASSIARCLEGADAVWIKAGLLGGPQSIDARLCSDYIRENADLVAAVLRGCEEADCRRVFFDSSEQVFGVSTDEVPADITTEPSSLNFYGASKLIAEKQLRAWSERTEGGERSVQIFRYPRIRTATSRDAIFHMASAALRGGPIRVRGDATHAIDFVDLQDVLAANLAALQRSPRFALYHIASGTPVTLLELARRVQDLAGKAGHTASIEHVPEPHKAVFEPHVLGLQWEPSYRTLGLNAPKTLDAMIQDTLDWLVENHESPTLR